MLAGPRQVRTGRTVIGGPRRYVLALLGFDLSNPTSNWVFTTTIGRDGRRVLDVARVGSRADETRAFMLAPLDLVR